jgi:hypothetical protein
LQHQHNGLRQRKNLQGEQRLSQFLVRDQQWHNWPLRTTELFGRNSERDRVRCRLWRLLPREMREREEVQQQSRLRQRLVQQRHMRNASLH